MEEESRKIKEEIKKEQTVAKESNVIKLDANKKESRRTKT